MRYTKKRKTDNRIGGKNNVWFPDYGYPPRARERRPGTPGVHDLFHDLLKGIVEDMEKNADDEAVRLGAGITLRVTEMCAATDALRKYALVLDKLPVEALVEVRNLLDMMLAEANALMEKYPIPEEAKPN